MSVETNLKKNIGLIQNGDILKYKFLSAKLKIWTILEIVSYVSKAFVAFKHEYEKLIIMCFQFHTFNQIINCDSKYLTTGS